LLLQDNAGPRVGSDANFEPSKVENAVYGRPATEKKKANRAKYTNELREITKNKDNKELASSSEDE
jgi:hypothetical protein